MAVLFVSYSTAQAQREVLIEGMVHYRIQNYNSFIRTLGNVERVSNYSYNYATNPLSLIYVLTPRYYSGGILSGKRIAGRNLSGMLPRTYYSNVRLQGRSRVPRYGKYFVVVALVDRYTKGIYDAYTFNKRVSIRRPWSFRRSAQNGGLLGLSDTQKKVRVRGLDNSARLGVLTR
jgi:hypothetical protein